MRFPNEYQSKEERAALWYEQIKEYLTDELLVELMGRFGFYPDTDAPVKTLLREAKDFAEANWSFRRKAGGGERASVVDNDQKVLECAELILETAKSLGLVKTEEKEAKGYDYIFPLGGFRAATYDRIRWSRKYSGKGRIVALTGHRDIQDIEIPFLDYMPEDERKNSTEYMTACYGVEAVFGCTGYKEDTENVQGSTGHLRAYENECYVLCAPTPRGKVRANTLDTLEYWRRLFRPEAGTSILCITSPIYTSYQMSALAGFAIENDLRLDFEACGECGKTNSVITNYLQEIKSTIDAFTQFASTY